MITASVEKPIIEDYIKSEFKLIGEISVISFIEKLYNLYSN